MNIISTILLLVLGTLFIANIQITSAVDSLIFVVDVSASMRREITAVQSAISDISDTYSTLTHYILSVFHDKDSRDPGVPNWLDEAEAYHYDNLLDFQTELDSLDDKLELGTKCRERAFSGIYQALLVADENDISEGDIFVFTDALSYRNDYRSNKVDRESRLTSFSVSFITAGHCGTGFIDENFVLTADASGGFTLPTDKDTIGVAVDIVKLFLNPSFDPDASVDLAPQIKISTEENEINIDIGEGEETGDYIAGLDKLILIASADFGDKPEISVTFSYVEAGDTVTASVEDRFETTIYEGDGYYAIYVDLTMAVNGNDYVEAVQAGEIWEIKVTFDVTDTTSSVTGGTGTTMDTAGRRRTQNSGDIIKNLFSLYSIGSDVSVSFELFDIDNENNFVSNQNGFLTYNLDFYDSFAVYVSSSDNNVGISDISIVSTDGLSVVTKSGSDVIYDDSESGYYSIFSFDELDTVLNDDLTFRLRAKGTDGDGVTFTRIRKSVIQVTSLTVELDCNDATFEVGTDTSCDITIYRSETDATEQDTFNISVVISNSYLRDSDDTVTLIYDSEFTLDAGETQGTLTLTLSFEDNYDMSGQTFSLRVTAISNLITSNFNYDVEGEFAVTGSIFGIEPTQCENDPCKCNEVINCRVCNEGSGCAQCNEGYFKIDYEYQCQSCSDTFGSYCMFCQDFNGCGQCKDGSTRTKDDDTNLWYCKKESDDSDSDSDANTDSSRSDCSIELTLCESYRCTLNNEDPNCETMETWGCRTCNDGYFIETRDYQCVGCNQIEGCLSCIDWNGCNECDSGYTKTWNSDCDFYTCV